MKKLWYILTIFAFCSNCSLSHYLSTSDPKNESRNEFNGLIYQLTLDTVFSFHINKEYYDSLSRSKKYCLNLYKFDRGGNASPVQIRMYDRSGKLISGWEQCYGDLNHFKLFDSVPMRRIPWLPNNNSITIKNDLKLFKLDDSDIEKIQIEIDSHDYTIILFYSVWAGWYSKDAISRTYEYVKSHQNISLLFLNIANK